MLRIISFLLFVFSLYLSLILCDVSFIDEKLSNITPTPPKMPSSFSATVIIELKEQSAPLPFSGRMYYDYGEQKKRVDVSIDSGFQSTFIFYKIATEYIYTYTNTQKTTCFSYGSYNSTLPGPTWLSKSTYVDKSMIMGQETDHWKGSGPHLGPNLGSINYDCYTNGTSILLLENDSFKQYFLTIDSTTLSSSVFKLPAECGQLITNKKI